MRKPTGNPSGRLFNIDAMGVGRLVLSACFLVAVFFFVSGLSTDLGKNSVLLIAYHQK